MPPFKPSSINIKPISFSTKLIIKEGIFLTALEVLFLILYHKDF